MSRQPPARGSPSRCTCNELLFCYRPLRWAMELSFAPQYTSGSGRWCNSLATERTMHAFSDVLTVHMFSSGVQKAKSFQMFFSYLFFSITQFGEKLFTVHALSQKKCSIAVQMACFGLTAALGDVHRTGACQGPRTHAVFVYHEVATNEYIHYRLTYCMALQHYFI